MDTWQECFWWGDLPIPELWQEKMQWLYSSWANEPCSALLVSFVHSKEVHLNHYSEHVQSPPTAPLPPSLRWSLYIPVHVSPCHAAHSPSLSFSRSVCECCVSQRARVCYFRHSLQELLKRCDAGNSSADPYWEDKTAEEGSAHTSAETASLSVYMCACVCASHSAAVGLH